MNRTFLSHTDSNANRAKVDQIMHAALDAVDPVNAVKNFLKRTGDRLEVAGRDYNLFEFENVYVVGAGKAGASMARAVEEVLGNYLSAGYVNVKEGYVEPTQKVTLNEAGHPIPTPAGFEGTKRIVEIARAAGENDLVICVISGGGSALMEAPVEGVTFEDMVALTDALLRCGAAINQMNAIRKHISQVKGGQLARLAYPATTISLLLSDVVGSPLDIIASGPTVPDTSTFADAWRVIEQFDLQDKIPTSIASHLQRGLKGEIPDTPKAGDFIFERGQVVLVGSNELAAAAAECKALELGFNTLVLSCYVEGEAREVAKVLAAVAKEINASGRPVARPACVVAGGEITVTVRGKGKGGRNQELPLAAAFGLRGLPDVAVAGLATDGTDGPTDAAGAVADGTTYARALEAGLDPQAYLANNDAFHFFEKLDDLIVTGPTNTNVNDLYFVFAF